MTANGGPRWEVVLIGDGFDLKALAEKISGIREDDGKYYLRSPRLEDADDRQQVAEVARQLVTEINGATRLRWANAKPVKMGSIQDLHAPKPTQIVAMGSAIVGPARVRGVASVRSKGQPRPSPQRKLERTVQAAGSDDDVRELLRHMGADDVPDWPALYKAYEVIRRTGWLDRVKVNQDDRSRFTGSAQPHRHHDRYMKQMPKNPMTHEEAVQFIQRLGREWLDDHLPPVQGNVDVTDE